MQGWCLANWMPPTVEILFELNRATLLAVWSLNGTSRSLPWATNRVASSKEAGGQGGQERSAWRALRARTLGASLEAATCHSSSLLGAPNPSGSSHPMASSRDLPRMATLAVDIWEDRLARALATELCKCPASSVP